MRRERSRRALTSVGQERNRRALPTLMIAALMLAFSLAPAAPPARGADEAAPAAPGDSARSDSSRAAFAAADSLASAPAESSAVASPASETPAPPAAPSHDYIAQVRADFTPENRAYASRRAWLDVIEPLYAIGVGLLLLFSGLAAKLRDIAEHMGPKLYVRVLVFFILYSLFAWALTFPLAWYAGFALEHQFGLSTQGFGAWLLDELKGQAVMIVLLGVLPFLALAYRAMEQSPKLWWLRIAVATLPLVTLFALIEPVVIDPIFNRFTPLKDEALRLEIVDLAKRAGIPGRNVYQVDASTRTTKFNAYVNGFGASQRVVIWDTTLKGMSRDELMFVIGHEMGHYVLGHVWKGIAAVSLASFVLLWLTALMVAAAIARWGSRWGIRALHDVASMPLLAVVLTIVSLAAQPFAYAYSRHVEHEADLFGLEVTRLNDAAARAFIKLGSQNRSNPEPGAVLRVLEYSHPPLLERVQTALDYHPWTAEKPNRYFHPGLIEP